MSGWLNFGSGSESGRAAAVAPSGRSSGGGRRPRSRGGRSGAARRYGERASANGYGGFGGSYQQTQSYRQDTTQLETQVVFVDQARTCLTVAETHLDGVASRADPSTLNATASGMVACLNLMRMTALERTDDKDGLNAAKAMVMKFEEKCNAKYGGVGREQQTKIMEIRNAICGHMMSVLNGDTSVPVFEVSSMSGATGEHDERRSVVKGMQEILRGGHEIENLREDVRQNAQRYREQLEEEAKDGVAWEERDGHRLFDTSTARRALQGDMTSLNSLKSGREMDREARESLKRMVRRDEEMARQSGANVRVDEHGCPDLMGHGDEDAVMEDVSWSESRRTRGSRPF